MNKILTFLFAVLFAGCGPASAANDYYNPTGSPAYKSADSSATMRAEFAAIGDGFDILPTMTGNGSEVVIINAGETAQSSITVSTIVDGTHTVASHSDTTATGAELETLTDTSDASSLHNHTTANLNDTTATGANLDTLTDTSDASALHNHTTANLNDTTATGANLNTLTDSSNADSLHTHTGTATGTNLLVNPNFLVNQEEYVDNTNLTSIGDYTYDMWMSTTATGENGVSVSGEDVTLEAVASLEQINDDLIANSGKVVIISIDDGTVDVSGGGITGTQTLTPSSAYSFTLTVTSSDGIVIQYESPGTFSGLKLELGSIATDYTIPQTTKNELKCYRYLQKYTYDSQFVPGSGYILSATSVLYTVPLIVTMSSVPTVTGNSLRAYGSTGYDESSTTDHIMTGAGMSAGAVVVYIAGFTGLGAQYSPAALFVYDGGFLTLDARY